MLVDIQKRAAPVSPALVPVAGPTLELRTRERFTQNEWNHIAVVSDGIGKGIGLHVCT